VTTKKNKIIFAAATVVIVLVTIVATGFYLLTLQSGSEPFRFSLAVSPENCTIVKGSNATITVEAMYLNGTSHPLMLSVSGGPNGTTYNFTPQTVEPTKNKAFISNLTINVPTDSVSSKYVLNITAATANGITNSITYALNVLEKDEIYVTGTVTANRWVGVYPTKIQFINVNTNQIYFANLDTVPGSQKGTYNITLPNHQFYQIFCWCNFMPESGHSSARAFTPMWFTLDCASGVTSLTKDFTDEDAGLV
jgi:hypothetical protein